ncbi:hypothetical protein BT63DRAFT_451035 [Microthyrium microscopicum]|uniref:HD domain-containing protein n=1 Tax=Microthyrium microscopicum TaxID=703497 RepID=A0A6A6UMT9_9PEZI|nr:hypothetical protein BT63DRAFT_451035 [Microthyrium microscopicum]
MFTNILVVTLTFLSCALTAVALLPSYPTRVIAGVTVIDTPIVRSAIDFARSHMDDDIFNHCMRAWVLGALMISKNSILREVVDVEVHAVGIILHDLGWDRRPNSDTVSKDRRFEVDGAIAAREFIRRHEDGKKWEERRVQLVWDSIALHAERKIAYFKEEEVQAVSKSSALDIGGADFGITQTEYALIAKEFKKDGLRAALNSSIVWLCQTKPASTMDNWMMAWGERYVANYSTAAGPRRIDGIFSNLRS